MHLGLIGPNAPDMFLDNIDDSLRRSGHDVSFLGLARPARGGRVGARVIDLAATAVPEVEDLVQRRLVRSALETGCDAIITTDSRLSPATIGALRRSGVPIALWYPDHVSNMGNQRMLTAPYSAFFFKDQLLVQRLRDTLNLPVWYLPEACNPRWHRPIGAAGSQNVLVVVGNTYPSRALLLRRLHAAGLPIRIYGGRAPRWIRDLLPAELFVGRAVFREEKSEVFRTAAAVINNLHPAEMHGVNARLFEATAAGAAVLCERRPALPDLFDVDREVVPFTTFDEMLGRAQELLADPQLTKDYGDAAAKRALAAHTYDDRLALLLEKLI